MRIIYNIIGVNLANIVVRNGTSKMKIAFVGEIRDPIHGLIPMTELEFRIIGTQAFQRLRNIKQLAMAHLGFHGAVHSRFGHSIGVMYIAYRMIRHLIDTKEMKASDEEIQRIRLSGLLHDIGHGPFSHVSEELLRNYRQGGEKTIGKLKMEEIHEEISRRIIVENSEILGIIGKEQANDISGLLATEDINNDFRHDIVSGPLDADKMDYLLRDSYFTGVKYGVFDLDRMINVLTLTKKRENNQKRLATRLEGIEAVEQYIMAKYFIAQQVYQHKTRHITDIMILEGIKGAIDSGNKKLRNLYSYNNAKEYIKNYLLFDDQTVSNIILNNGNKKSVGYQYFDLLRKRNLLKELFTCKILKIMQETEEASNKLKRIKEGNCPDLLKEISSGCGLKPKFTHIKIYSVKSPLIQRSYLDEQKIRVKQSDGSTCLLDNESILYHSIIKNAEKLHISVFGFPEKIDSDKTRYRISQQIEKILKAYFGG